MTLEDSFEFFEKSEDSFSIYLREVRRLLAFSEEDERRYFLELASKVSQLQDLMSTNGTGIPRRKLKSKRLSELLEIIGTTRISPGLFKLIQQKSEECVQLRNILVTRPDNLRAVVHVAKKFAGYATSSTVGISDLVQYGNMGLIVAVEKFDPARGNKFNTYAYWWIKQSMARGFNESDGAIRLPEHIHEKLQKMRRLVNDFTQYHGRAAETSELYEIARLVKLDFDRIHYLFDQTSVSLDEDAVGDAGNGPLSDIIADPEAEAQIRRKEELIAAGSRIKLLVNGLNYRRKQVLVLRYGVYDGTPRTLEEIGYIMDISRGRVGQLEQSALQFLRKASETDYQKSCE